MKVAKHSKLRNAEETSNKYDTPWESVASPKQPSYQYAYDHQKQIIFDKSFDIYDDSSSFYKDPTDIYNHDNTRNDSDEDLYSLPYDCYKDTNEERLEESSADIVKQEKFHRKDLYENSNRLQDEIQYTERNKSMKKIQSKPDTSNNSDIIFGEKSPVPKPRLVTHTSEPSPKMTRSSVINKKTSCPSIGNEKTKKSPPRPKPRSKSAFCEKPSAEPMITVNVKDRANQLRDKINPVGVVPTMTQAKIEAVEYASYENNF